MVVGAQPFSDYFRPIFREFLFDDRSERILDPPLINFAARHNDCSLLFQERLNFKDSPIGFCLFHSLFLDHERDNARARNLIARSHCGAAMP